VYWPEPGEKTALGHLATSMPGFARRDELIERYSALTGRTVDKLGFYVAFAYWKLACIIEGVYARYVAGAMGDDNFDYTAYPDNISWLATQSEEAAARIGV